MIRFNRYDEKAFLGNPPKNFEIHSQPIEYREDPLIGLSSFARTGRAFGEGIYKTDEDLLERLIEETSRQRNALLFYLKWDKAIDVSLTLPLFLPLTFPESERGKVLPCL